MGRGRPKGIPSESRKYGTAKTEVMRVPAGYKNRVEAYLLSFDALIDDYSQRASHTRDWTQAKRLLAELEGFRVGLDSLRDEGT